VARERKRSKQRRAARARQAPARPFAEAAEEPGLREDPELEDAGSLEIEADEPILPEAGVGGGGSVPPVRPVATGGGDEDFEEEEELDELPAPRVAPRAPAPTGAVGRVTAFLRASWAELQRVQWPDRRQVGQATAVVLGFVVIAGGFLGLADLVASNIVDAIL
jgi:preprotein translocase SecE subunit